MATLACRVTKLKRAQSGHRTIEGAKFGQTRSTLSARYAVYRQTDRQTDRNIQHTKVKVIISVNLSKTQYFHRIHPVFRSKFQHQFDYSLSAQDIPLRWREKNSLTCTAAMPASSPVPVPNGIIGNPFSLHIKAMRLT